MDRLVIVLTVVALGTSMPELATSVMLGLKLVVVVLDNSGFGCIDRLQHATGGAGFNNLLADARHVQVAQIDFAAHARSLGTAGGGPAPAAGPVHRARTPGPGLCTATPPTV